MIIKTEFDLKQLVYYVEDSIIHNGLIIKIEYSTEVGKVGYIVAEESVMKFKWEYELFSKEDKDLLKNVLQVITKGEKGEK